MAQDRVELNEELLDDITGGDLVWLANGTMSSNDYDSGTYHFDVTKWEDIRKHMYTNCQGFSDQKVIESLLEAKLITK